MISVYERGILARYITTTSTKARHQAKLLSLLDWIQRWGYTSPAVLQALWGLDKSVINRMVRRYVREELIAEVPVYSCRDKRVFILKPEGLRTIESFHQAEFKYNTKPSSFPIKTLTHDLMVQYLVAKGCCEGNYRFFINEAEQGKDGTGKKRRLDAIVYNCGELQGIEVECSSKTIPYRLDIIRRYRSAIVEEQKVSKILMFSHKRRYLRDAERIHDKLFADVDNNLDRSFYEAHLKFVFSRQITAELYESFWVF
ncbi:hypothetical protein AAEU28_17245 [Pseudoalteromonas sp. SS15]|uniref:hypothetical protein n=1 Tax=Pseudoalteromonas sp. SS15 TaxID=3139393 RepID=UPI003BA9D43C